MKLPAHIHGLFDELKSLLPKAVFPAPGDTHHAYTQYDPDKFAPVITHVALPAGRVREIEAKFLELRRAIDEAPEPASAEDKHTFPFAINGKVVELPRRVVRAAEEVGVYMNERFDGPWAFCGIQKRVNAPPAVAAKEPEYSDAEIDEALCAIFKNGHRFAPSSMIRHLRRTNMRTALRILHRNRSCAVNGLKASDTFAYVEKDGECRALGPVNWGLYAPSIPPAPAVCTDEIDRRNGKTPALDSVQMLIESYMRVLPGNRTTYYELRIARTVAAAAIDELKALKRRAGDTE